MRLTTKGRYAVTAMLDLALHQEQGPITLADISARQGVSISYLEQLFAKLRRGKLVQSVRGPGGGYRLAGGADSISVAQIVEAVNDSMDATRCLGKGDCQHGEVCLTHHLWSDLSNRLRQFLNEITLAELVSRDDIQRVRTRQDSRGCNGARQAVAELERII
ncbi:Fe-S cluster assembly transcriptional regulator IscR [Halopseudomonas nanhaiensis]|uniref:Fe-S cluster assembly transcriptional regulator IscR n=1 Tax=Halopseudomonas nanhaiensis TaxID=2830842 RepID=UPI001CBBCCDF|nr:Fe-S cluster assembly transcriptional regulator IscR [Halopseudomonas nanhaiensis]UAW99866.1 Fe-S cluster assembly transcriptional regulator IscR [Halopseudomonas nanhaiensis]